ncbi:MAG: TAXI family TRAP transporter solute-binding subunit [Magnetovibrionaceae bacterium]
MSKTHRASGRMMSTLAVFGLVAGAAFGGGGSAEAAEKRFMTIGTGGVTGVYYPSGGAICRLVNKKRKEHGIRCSVESTEGSISNIRALAENDIELGIAQSDVQLDAYQGKGEFNGDAMGSLRTLFSLQLESMHLIVRKSSGIKEVADLRGKRVNIGNPGSGHRASTELLLDAAGLQIRDLALASELKSSEQAAALCDNKLDAVVFTVGTPNGAVKEATTSCDAEIVPIAGELRDAFLAMNQAYVPAVIPGGTYRGSPADVETFGVRATVVTTDELPADMAYEAVRAVFENFNRFQALHPAFANLSKEKMVTEGLVAPMHEGAKTYFTEIGLLPK